MQFLAAFSRQFRPQRSDARPTNGHSEPVNARAPLRAKFCARSGHNKILCGAGAALHDSHWFDERKKITRKKPHFVTAVQVKPMARSIRHFLDIVQTRDDDQWTKLRTSNRPNLFVSSTNLHASWQPGTGPTRPTGGTEELHPTLYVDLDDDCTHLLDLRLVRPVDGRHLYVRASSRRSTRRPVLTSSPPRPSNHTTQQIATRAWRRAERRTRRRRSERVVGGRCTSEPSPSSPPRPPAHPHRLIRNFFAHPASAPGAP